MLFAIPSFSNDEVVISSLRNMSFHCSLVEQPYGDASFFPHTNLRNAFPRSLDSLDVRLPSGLPKRHSCAQREDHQRGNAANPIVVRHVSNLTRGAEDAPIRRSVRFNGSNVLICANYS